MKPVIVGIDNPHSRDPRDALSPHFPNSSGHRLWQMLHERAGVTKSAYTRRFRRTNVRDWVGVFVLKKEFKPGQTVVLLGGHVRQCFGLPKVLLHPVVRDGITYRQVPHPSGRTRFYNDPTQRAMVAILLEELYHDSR